MSETTTTTDAAEMAPGGGEQQEQGKTFTQEEVNRIVRERAERVAKQLYPDYEELQTKAAGAKTLEERLGSLESELVSTKASALRTSIAARFGISTVKGENDSPSDADLFLTGSDEATLTAQAERLAGRVADVKKHGNVAPKEGGTKTTGTDDRELREFANQLFGEAE